VIDGTLTGTGDVRKPKTFFLIKILLPEILILCFLEGAFFFNMLIDKKRDVLLTTGMQHIKTDYEH